MSQRQDLTVDDSRGLIESEPATIQDRMGAFATGEAPTAPPPPGEPTPPPEPEPTPEVVPQEEVPAEESEHPPSDQPPAVEEPEAEAEELITVMVGGEAQEVTFDELKRGYSRTADYTRKTQRLAQDRDLFDVDAKAVRGERERYSTLLENLEAAITQNTPQEPDWASLRAKDPGEFAAQFAVHQQNKEKLQQVQAERQRVAEAQQQENARNHQEHLQGEQERLLDAVPAWKDAEKATKERADLLAYGQTVGFTTDELNNVADHRAIVMLRKAMLYDRLQQGKPAVRRKTKGSPVVKPGGAKEAKKPPVPGQVARERLSKTGSVRDATAVFLDRLQAGG